MWDSAFTVQFGAYARRAFPFINLLNNFYAKQHDDGAICREISPADGSERFSTFDPDGTGPNVLAWAEWRHYRISGDESRLADVFFPLLAYHRWLRANRSWPNGLYWATGYSSGMFNMPRIPDSENHHRHWSWIDASMQAAISCSVLERLANVLDESDFVIELAEEHALLKSQINRLMWNEENHFYYDIDAQGNSGQVKSIGAYWGLLDPALIPQERIEPFVRHLRDNGVFKVKHRIPSISADSTGYEAETGNYWHGGVWAPTNFMVLKGLRSVGQNTLAHAIACNHLQNVTAVFEHTDTLWEYYAPVGNKAGESALPNYVGWAGLTSVAMLIEDVIGLWVDWPLRQVVWHRYLDTDRHYGVQNYPLGTDGTLSLMGDRQKIVVTTDVPFTLTIRDLSLNLKVPVSAGTVEIDLV
jgi:glycogen debranching enzyme